MNTPAKDSLPGDFNWVDYVDSLRRGASQKQIAAYADPLAPETSVSIPAPERVRHSGTAPQQRSTA